MHSTAAAPFLLADVGGTWARFAIMGEHPRDLLDLQRYRCADFESIEQALGSYLSSIGGLKIGAACLALPGPVNQAQIRTANNPWTLSRHAIESALGVPVSLINDFAAQALALDLLHPHEVQFLGSQVQRAGGTQVVVGPGTGLGVAVRLPSGEVLPSEAGHVGWSPTSAHELSLMELLLSKEDRISVERLVSGPGLVRLYMANRQLHDRDHELLETGISPEQVYALAVGGDPVACRAIDDFFNVLATFVGDLALTFWATGGVFLSGGVIQKLKGLIDEDLFRRRFEAKGRLGGFSTEVTTAIVAMDEPGLVGCGVRLRRGSAAIVEPVA